MCCPEDKFLKLIQEREPIYNKKISVHKGVIENLWKEIAMEMNMSSAECKFKWKNLRNSYARHLRESKVFNTVRPRKQWYLADSMSFLHDHVVKNRYDEYSNDESSATSSSSSFDPFARENEAILYCSAQTYSDIKHELAGAGHHSGGHSSSTSTTLTELRECDTQSTRNIKRQKYNNFMEQLTKQTSENGEINVTDVEHPLVTFFFSLVPDYEKLSPKRQRLFKEKTLNYLHKLVDEEEGNNKYE
ncbi:hypothetical protein O3M35_006728 [Rhynocoris fuscipes]|uniref:MADF domain-containing protein n=1 Tax=Rhynocoris fuscipes TaxID=488301 RepID=A0AAW1DF36_9HEMI